MLIFVVDDEAGIRDSLSELLAEHEVRCFPAAEPALAELQKVEVDLVITDHRMPGLSGIELIRRGKQASPATSFFLLTAYGTVQQAVEALQSGAEDYLTKPFNPSEIELRVSRIQDLRFWKAGNDVTSERQDRSCSLIGKSAFIREAREFIESAARAHSPVLLLGPSGTGKEVIANAIHQASPRKSRPFVAINCAAFNEQLIEAELFGYEKGAFTGANSTKPGKFELAKGGTLFLDEVGELPQGLQAKLLRVLQEKEFYRLGGMKQVHSDARVIAATNRPLKEMVQANQFREDLYFRLNVLSFTLQPLARRPEDIPLLLDFFWEKITQDCNKRLTLAPETRARLENYNYPGNVRELQNILERLVVLGNEKNPVRPEALPPELKSIPSPAGGTAPGTSANASFASSLGQASFKELVDECSRQLLLQAMERSGQSQIRAAKLLKMTRGSFQYQLRRLGLETLRILAQDDAA